MELGIRIEKAMHFGWLTFLSQIVLFVIIPALLDYLLVFTPLLKLWYRKLAQKAASS